MFFSVLDPLPKKNPYNLLLLTFPLFHPNCPFCHLLAPFLPPGMTEMAKKTLCPAPFFSSFSVRLQNCSSSPMVTTSSTGENSAVEASNHSKSVQTPGKPILIPVPKWHTGKNWTDKTIRLKYPPFIKDPTIILSYRELIIRKQIRRKQGKSPPYNIELYIPLLFFYAP